jgi:hypothetical protein
MKKISTVHHSPQPPTPNNTSDFDELYSKTYSLRNSGSSNRKKKKYLNNITNSQHQQRLGQNVRSRNYI